MMQAVTRRWLSGCLWSRAHHRFCMSARYLSPGSHGAVATIVQQVAGMCVCFWHQCSMARTSGHHFRYLQAWHIKAAAKITTVMFVAGSVSGLLVKPHVATLCLSNCSSWCLQHCSQMQHAMYNFFLLSLESDYSSRTLQLASNCAHPQV